MKRLLMYLFVIGFLTFPSISLAASFYVNEDAKSGGDGSKDEPFEDLDDAIDASGSGDKIHISKGSYGGDFTIPSSVEIYGDDEDDVIIKGPIIASDDVKLEKITISGGYHALAIKKDAEVSIEKCIIKNATKTGINTEKGNGKIIVKDSKITKNGKGLYVQEGNKIEMSDSQVTGNSEEGIDLRNDNDGYIKDNEISDNGESGIEIILGKTDILISGNKIKDNDASGIATQYYKEFDDNGDLVVNGNDIEGNEDYGVKCGIPQGGSGLTSSYWEKSIKLEDNNFKDNDEGDVASRCKMLTTEELAQLEKEEAEKAAQEELLKKQQEEERKSEEQKQREEEERRKKLLEEAIEKTRTEAERIESEINMEKDNVENTKNEMSKKNWFSRFFLGPKEEDLLKIEQEVETLRSKQEELKNLASSAQTDELRADLDQRAVSFDESIREAQSFLDSKKSEKSFWVRVKGLFDRK